jgi:uncharacterized cupredoxin-like copper-binding protein
MRFAPALGAPSRRPLLPVLLLAVLGGVGSYPAAQAAGRADRSAPRTLRIVERDFRISAGTKVVRPGELVLRVHNLGPDSHELIVVRRGGGLPLRSDGLTVDEDAVEQSTAGTLEPGEPGSDRELRVLLRPGRYVLFCNMSGHYLGGMHTDLVVR